MKIRRKLATWLLLLSPILQIYGWGQFDFAFLSTTFLGIYCLIRGEIKFKSLPRFLLAYFIYWMFVHVVSATSIIGAIPLGAMRCLITFTLFFSIIDLSYLIQVYKKIVLACVLFFYLQFLFGVLLDYHLIGIFPYLPIAFTDDILLYSERFLTMNRPSSFFSEPAHFAQYIIPYLGIMLFDQYVSNRKKIKKVSYIVLTLLLLQSGNALLGLAVLFLGYTISTILENKKRLVLFPLIILGASVLVNFYSDTAIGEKMLARQVQISSKSYQDLGYSTSGYERIYRGYFVYSEYPLMQKVIGNDNPDYKIAASRTSEVAATFKENDLYFNTIQSFLLNTGLLGLLLMVSVLLGIWKKTNACGKSILSVFIAFSTMSAMYFSATMCLYLIIPFFLNKNIRHETILHIH